MVNLSKGDRGKNVEAWQYFLVGLGYYWLEVTGVFDDETVLVTQLYQADSGVKADGQVDPTTLGLARNKGFSWPEEEVTEDFPQKPQDAPPLSAAGRIALFGEFRFKAAPTEGNPEAIQILGDYVEKNIVMVEIPQLAQVKGAPKRVPFHRLIVDQTLRLFQAWEDAGLMSRILTWGGSWAPRFIRGSRTTLSNHSYATAFDINAAQNYLGVKPAPVGKVGSVRELVPLAVEHGFTWGGWFTKRDGMHFEAFKVL